MKLNFIIFFFLIFCSIVNAGMYLPTFKYVQLEAVSLSPTENSITTALIITQVEDLDGAFELNESGCACSITHNTIWDNKVYEQAYNNSCEKANETAFTKTYLCSIQMQYWYSNGTYTLNMTARGTPSFIYNTSEQFNYSSLLASSINTTTVDYGAITKDDYDNLVITSPTMLINTGNQNLSVYITGADVTHDKSIAPDINIDKFHVDTDQTIAGSVQLDTSKQQISQALVPVEDSLPGNNYEELFWFFQVPELLQSGTYSATWILEES